jgi:preprotein translocase subunit SecG
MENILLIAMVVIAILIIIVVLLQKSASMGLGAYSGSNESLFGAKGPASFLAKSTFALGFAFVVVSIWLGVIYNAAAESSLLDNVDTSAAPTITAPTPAIDAPKMNTEAPKVPDAK